MFVVYNHFPTNAINNMPNHSATYRPVFFHRRLGTSSALNVRKSFAKSNNNKLNAKYNKIPPQNASKIASIVTNPPSAIVEGEMMAAMMPMIIPSGALVANTMASVIYKAR